MSFVAANGRIPFAADSPPAWEYSAWLRYLVLHAESLGVIPKRWHYVFESITNAHVLDAPLPQTDFSGAMEGGRRAGEIFLRWCDRLNPRRDRWTRMRVVMEFLAWGFGFGDAPPQLDHDEALELYKAVNSSELLEIYQTPGDLFGWVLSQSLGNGWNPNAFYPTPDEVVDCMVQIVMHDTSDVDQRGMTVCDPCCGTGRMLLHAGQKSMRLYGADIDYMMVLATKINMAFWCPWGLFQWDDEFFDQVGRPGPKVKSLTGQLQMFGGNLTEDRKNKGRPRAEVQAEIYGNYQIGLFGPNGET